MKNMKCKSVTVANHPTNHPANRLSAVLSKKVKHLIPGLMVLMLFLFASSFTLYADGPVTDEFSGSTIQDFWTVKKPKGNVYLSGGKLVIVAPVNTYMRNLNDTAPRIEQPIDNTKDWDLEIHMDHVPSYHQRGAGLYLGLSGNRLFKIAEKFYSNSRRQCLMTWGSVYQSTWGWPVRYRLRKRGNRLYLWARISANENSYKYYGSRTYSGTIEKLGLYAYRTNYNLQYTSSAVAKFSYIRVKYAPFKLREDDFNTNYTKSFWMFMSDHKSGWSHNYNGSYYTRLQVDGQQGSSKPKLFQPVSPNENWIVETRVIVRQLQGNYSCGGMFLFQNGGTFLNLAARIRDSNGHRIWALGKNVSYSGTICYLRVKKQENQFTAYLSTNGTDWIEGGTRTYTSPVTHVGVYAYNSSGRNTTKVDFDYFNVSSPITDPQPPVSSIDIQPAPNALGWNNTDVLATISATDDNSGVKEITYNVNKESAYYASAVAPGDVAAINLTDPDSATYTIEYFAEDEAGNPEAPPNFATIKIDRVLPTASHAITGSPTGNPDEYDCGAAFTILATDDYADVREINYSINDVWHTLPGYRVDHAFGAIGTYNVKYFAVDNAGNVGAETIFTVNIADVTAPVSTFKTNPETPLGLDGWYKGSLFQIDISASDSCSGVDKIFYKKDTDTAFTEYTGPVNPDDGQYIIEYYAVDLAGNEETPHHFTAMLKVDITPPDASHALHGHGDGYTFIDKVNIQLRGTDLTAGVKEISYSEDGGTFGTPVPGDIINIPNYNTLGVHTFDYKVVDIAGNETLGSVTFEIVEKGAAATTIKDIIETLPPAAFNKKNNQKTLLNKLNSILTMIDDGLLADAADKLENDIKKKMDGCVVSGAPDKNDWVTDCDAQAELNVWIDALIEALRS